MKSGAFKLKLFDYFDYFEEIHNCYVAIKD